MKDFLPEGVEKFWVNNLWDRTIFEKSHLGDKFVHQRELLLQHIVKYEPTSILILCCGIGIETLEITQLDFVKEIIAIDINKESCKKTKEIVSRIPKIKVVNMNVYDITYENDFEAVVCFDALHHLGKQEILLNKIHKALKNEGYFIGNYFGKECFIEWEIKKHGLLKYLIINTKHHFSNLLLKLHMLPKKFVEAGWIRTFLLTKVQVVKLLKDYGFKILELNSEEWHFFVSKK